jgi:transposase
LELSPEQRADLEAAIRPDKAEKRVVRRAQAALLMADGVATADIAVLLGVDLRTVMKWRNRFRCADPVTKLADAHRSGRPPSLSRPPTARRSSQKPAESRAT